MPEDNVAQIKDHSPNSFFGFARAHRSSILRWMAYLSMVVLGLLAIINLIVYFQTGTKQLVWVALFSAASALLISICLFLANHDRLLLGGIILGIGILIAVLGPTIFLSSYTLNLLIAGLIFFVGLGVFVFPPRGWISIPFVIILLGGYYYINNVIAPVRFDPAQVTILRYYMAALAPVAAVFMIIRILYIVLQLLNSIRSRLILASVAVVALAILTTSSISILIGLQNNQRQMNNQLESVATLKTQTIELWITDLQNNLSSVLTGNDANRRMRSLLDTSTESFDVVDNFNNQNEMLGRFLQVKLDTKLYEDIFLLDNNGNIILTTNNSATNIALIQSDWKYLRGVQGKYVTPFYSTVINAFDIRPTIIVSMPVVGLHGETLGTLAGRADLSVLSEIMLERSGLGDTGETYIVGTDHTMLTNSRFPEWQNMLNQVVNTDGVAKALTQENGSSRYIGYRGVPVVGVYHWIPSLQVSLMAEQDQTEAFQAVYTNIIINIVISIIILILSVVASLFLSNSIAKPLSKLADTASAISAGNLEQRADVTRNDEVGALAIAFNAMTDQLNALIDSLEVRVSDRTKALEKRATQIETVADTASDIAAIDDLNELLSHAVEVIRDRFHFYHAGIFLVDEQNEYAVLRAATGEAGKEMLNRHHKLRVGEVGIVGYAVGKGEPRITSNVSNDTVHYINPLLPDTRSEIALPLRVSSNVIGALDVQSREVNAFQPEDVRILQIMADQLAVAISKASLLQELQNNVVELQAATRQFTRQGWEDYLATSREKVGYRLNRAGVQPITYQTSEIRQVLAMRQTVVLPGAEPAADSSLIVPIKLRGQIIGVVNLKLESQVVPEELVEFVENASERLALALENARLVSQIQGKAEREHLISEITSRVRATTDVDLILQTTVRELGRVLGASEVLIQLQTRDDQEAGA